MNSLEKYISIRQDNRAALGKDKLKCVDRIAAEIVAELEASSFLIKKSPFLQETIKLIELVSKKETVSEEVVKIAPTDAYIIVKTIYQYYITGETTADCAENRYYATRLFGEVTYKNTQKKEIVELSNFIQELNDKLSKMRKNISDKMNKEKLPEANTKKEASVEQESKETVKEEKTPDSTLKEADTAVANASASLDGLQLEQAIAIRSANCKANVQAWHEEIAKTQQEFFAMQPMVSQLLQKMMSFSNEVTENYVLQFAKMQIELFNLVSDNYDYHKKAVADTDHNDYKKAVSNYRSFMELILDNLSAFGVEEISSKEGDAFDGALHEVIDNSDFSPKTATVKESVRTGFRYKDIILQKEKIQVA